MRFLPGHRNRAWCVAYAPDSRFLVSGGWKDDVRVWDLGTAAQTHAWPPMAVIVRDLTFGLGGDLVIQAALSDSVLLRAFPDGRVERALTLPETAFEPAYHHGANL